MKLKFIFIILCLLPAARAQQAPAPPRPEPRPIQDNSFLVEEAYNQEFGVVQHISNFTRLWQSKQWAYTFTQEWPWDPNPRHQFSYTIPIVDPGASEGTGLGDIALNYRYQLLGNGDARAALAPRLSLLLPTGNYRLERGSGGVGVQGSLPLSLVLLPKHVVTHWNVNTTIVPKARSVQGDRASTFGYGLGQSVIWLARPRFNVLLETVWNGSEVVIGRGMTSRSHSLFLNPGIRWAYNFRSGLQIVPGIAVPVGVGPSAGERGIFLYLSFEHPFREIPQK